MPGNFTASAIRMRTFGTTPPIVKTSNADLTYKTTRAKKWFNTMASVKWISYSRVVDPKVQSAPNVSLTVSGLPL